MNPEIKGDHGNGTPFTVIGIIVFTLSLLLFVIPYVGWVFGIAGLVFLGVYVSEYAKASVMQGRGIKTAGVIGGIEEIASKGLMYKRKVIHVTYTDWTGMERTGRTFRLYYRESVGNRSGVIVHSDPAGQSGEYYVGQEIGIEYIDGKENIILLENFDIEAAKAEVRRKAWAEKCLNQIKILDSMESQGSPRNDDTPDHWPLGTPGCPENSPPEEGCPDRGGVVESHYGRDRG